MLDYRAATLIVAVVMSYLPAGAVFGYVMVALSCVSDPDAWWIVTILFLAFGLVKGLMKGVKS